MTENEQILGLLQVKVAQLLSRFNELRKENAELRVRLEEKARLAERLQAELNTKCSEYDSLKAAKVLSVSDTDIEQTKDRLARMIRDVNKCIAVLKQ